MPRNKQYDTLFNEFGDIGLEIEFTTIDRGTRSFIDDIQMIDKIRIEHDASNETPVLSLSPQFSAKVDIESEDFKNVINFFSTENSVAGGELVSPVYSLREHDWKTTVFKLCSALSRHGEIEECSRDSIHVHVNVGQAVSIETLLRILNLCMSYEYILYKLGGMGCINRGVHNSFIYQRPYTPKGPPVVKVGDKRFPIIDIERLLSSKNKQDFFMNFGDSAYCYNEGQRYVTQRYMGVNFYSALVYGSIEFRHANKTLNPHWIIAWAEFCSSLVKKAFYQEIDETETIMRPLTLGIDYMKKFGNNDFNKILSSLVFLSEESKYNLLEIWRLSEDFHYQDNWTYSHLNNPTFYRRGAKVKPLPLGTRVNNSNFVDVHQLENEFKELSNNLRAQKQRKQMRLYENLNNNDDIIHFDVMLGLPNRNKFRFKKPDDNKPQIDIVTRFISQKLLDREDINLKVISDTRGLINATIRIDENVANNHDMTDLRIVLYDHFDNPDYTLNVNFTGLWEDEDTDFYFNVEINHRQMHVDLNYYLRRTEQILYLGEDNDIELYFSETGELI